MRGATAASFVASMISDFNPRSPCGERHLAKDFSVDRLQFQSTLPMRGATKSGFQEPYRCPISIHAPHAGSDFQSD